MRGEDFVTDPDAQYGQVSQGTTPDQDTAVPVTTSFGTTLVNATDAANARSILGLGTIATQSAASVAITGGAINGAVIGGVAPAAITGTDINATGAYKVDGTQVVTNQQAAVPDAAGGATVDTEARAAINSLLAALRVHGLIAT